MYAWMTARRIKPGRMERFKAQWEAPLKARSQLAALGVVKAYFLQDDHDPDCMIGLAFFENKEAYDRFVASAAESGRKQAMGPLVEEVEWERFFEVTEY
jgi:hypothetical protein